MTVHLQYSLITVKSSKKSLSVICKILRLFVNTLTLDDKYSLLNRENLTQPIQIHLSQKQQTVSQFLIPFLKITLKFEHFQKNTILIAYVFQKFERGGWIDV